MSGIVAPRDKSQLVAIISPVLDDTTKHPEAADEGNEVHIGELPRMAYNSAVNVEAGSVFESAEGNDFVTSGGIVVEVPERNVS
jgi:hypothetical protein